MEGACESSLISEFGLPLVNSHHSTTSLPVSDRHGAESLDRGHRANTTRCTTKSNRNRGSLATLLARKNRCTPDHDTCKQHFIIIKRSRSYQTHFTTPISVGGKFGRGRVLRWCTRKGARSMTSNVNTNQFDEK